MLWMEGAILAQAGMQAEAWPQPFHPRRVWKEELVSGRRRDSDSAEYSCLLVPLVKYSDFPVSTSN